MKKRKVMIQGILWGSMLCYGGGYILHDFICGKHKEKSNVSQTRTDIKLIEVSRTNDE